MIDFYYWPTPNGWKVSIMLEETGLPYTLKPVNIGAGDQFKPAFMAISPNARMPAIVDHDTPDGPMPVFESGAILIHLAEKTGRFMPVSAGLVIPLVSVAMVDSSFPFLRSCPLGRAMGLSGVTAESA